MKQLIFYTDNIQGFSLGMMQSLVQPLEYQGSNQFVHTTNINDIIQYLSNLENADHLEGIHILGVTPQQGEAQDTLENMLSNFADVPFRFVFWASDYGTPVVNPNIEMVRSTSGTIIDAYMQALLAYKDDKNLSEKALSYYWPLRGYLTHDYAYTSKEETALVNALYEVFGLEYVTTYGYQDTLQGFYNLHKHPLDRFLARQAQLVAKKARNAKLAVIDGVQYQVLATDTNYNEIADKVLTYELETENKVAVLMLTIDRNQTRVTIRTHNIDAVEVGNNFVDNAQGMFNASTVFIGAQLTPDDLITGLKNMKEKKLG